MEDSKPYAVELTDELRKFVKATAINEAKKLRPRHVKYADVIQEVIVKLIFKPPIYDPKRGAKVTTFLHTCIRNIVIDYLDKEIKHAERYKQHVKGDTESDQKPAKPSTSEMAPSTKSIDADDILKHVDCVESQKFCRLVLHCNGNLSDVARRMGIKEGTVRYRLRLLGPKLEKAGFDVSNYLEYR